jgi:hypothetical protein
MSARDFIGDFIDELPTPESLTARPVDSGPIPDRSGHPLIAKAKPQDDSDSIPPPMGGSVEESNRETKRRDPDGDSFRPIPASELGPGEAVPWLVTGYIGRGFTTLLISLWKAGKTTFVSHILAATADGGHVAGDVSGCRVLIVTEESGALWAKRRDTIGIGDNCDFVIKPFRGKPSQRKWAAFIDLIAGWVREGNYELVVFDTLASVAPYLDENDSAAMLATLTPLHGITEAGGAVLIVHHPRKGDGNEGQASRGSGALPGFVDCIVEMRRLNAEDRNDRRRVLASYSRFDETPDELVIELAEDESGYRIVGTKRDCSRSDRMKVIAKILPDADSPMTVDEVRAAWPDDGIPKPGKATVAADLSEGFRTGLWCRTGDGKKGSPYKYAKTAFPSAVCDSSTDGPIGGRIESDAENSEGEKL